MNEETLFIEAMEIRDAAEQAAYLDRVCAGDAALRVRLERLLDEHRRAGSFLGHPAVAPGATRTFDPSPEVETAALAGEALGTQIGPYKLLQQIGEGGMGTVYMAEQTEPIHRKVALKVIKAGMDSRQVVARFEAERQALAMMDHVNIARVFDGGTTENGRPYFVMELVHGVPITKYCDDNHLTPRERLELFVPVCQAIQHAHQKGIIHRDIKPSNVMVTLYDGKPVPKVIDFGVAKATEQKLTERTLFTQYGTMIGTLEYMSPEQAEMSALGIDTRSDIYSLGVLLYELLTGSTPLSHKRLKEAAYAEILRMIKVEEPQKPSTRLSDSGEALASISAQRKTEPAKLSKLMRGELDWIVMKTLEKDRNRRYDTATAFAADVQRYLADEPVQACPPSVGYRLRKFARRNRVALSTAGLLSAMLMLGSLVSTWQAIRATRAETLAQVRLRAETDAHNEAEAARTEEAAQRKIAEQQRVEADRQRQQAEDARKQAVANLLKAREAVDQMLTRVAEERIAHVPQMEQLRRQLLIDAIQFYRGFLDGKNADPELRAEAARAYNRVGNIHFALGESAQAEEAYGKAIILFNQLVAEHPSEPSYLFNLSISYVELGNLHYKAGRLQEALRAAREALALRQKVLANSPGEPDHQIWVAHTHIYLGCHLYADGRFEEAAQEFRQSLKLSEKLVATFPANAGYRYDLALSQWSLAQVLMATGRAGEAKEEYRRGLAEYRQVVKQDPKSDLAASNLAVLLATCPIPELRDVGEAVKLAKQAVELAPQDRQHWRALGIAQYQAGDSKAAVAALEEATKFGGGNSDWYWLAIAYSRLGDAKGAEKAYRKLLELSPRDAGAHNNVAWLLATCPDPKIRNAGEALELAKKAVELAPKEGNQWNTLGAAHYRAGDWKAAVTALERSMKLRKGGDSFDWFFLGMAHWQLGDKEQAHKWYDQAVQWMEKNKPQDEELRRFRAEAAELLQLAEPRKEVNVPKKEEKKSPSKK